MRSKIILSIETSSTICGVSVFNGNKIMSTIERESNRKHAEILPGFIKELLKDSDISLDSLDAIAVSIGPGSFTGLRIGLGFAKGIAFAQNLPIIPVPTIQSLAYSLKMIEPLNGIVYSHSSKVYFQEFQWDNGLPIPQEKPLIGDINLFIDHLKNENSFQSNCDRLISKSQGILNAQPSSKYIGELAIRNFDDWIIKKPYELVPEYIAEFEINNANG